LAEKLGPAREMLMLMANCFLAGGLPRAVISNFIGHPLEASDQSKERNKYERLSYCEKEPAAGVWKAQPSLG